ncbi:MAG: hypothetical protein EOM91_15530 [Sphingobacteriia bacterium]|nr:hypothetical protein [Sphingobacteriia bacterium]
MSTKTATLAKELSEVRERIATTLTDELSEVRERIAALHAERDELLKGSVPKAEFKQRADAWIDRSAAAFGEDLRYKLTSFRGASSHTFSSVNDTSAFAVRGRAHPQFEGFTDTDLGPLVCWLFGDDLKRRFGELIGASDYPEGLPTAERPAALARIAAELDTLELREEALICRADASGMVIPRRNDVRPEIVLMPQPEEATAP